MESDNDSAQCVAVVWTVSPAMNHCVFFSVSVFVYVVMYTDLYLLPLRAFIYVFRCT